MTNINFGYTYTPMCDKHCILGTFPSHVNKVSQAHYSGGIQSHDPCNSRAVSYQLDYRLTIKVFPSNNTGFWYFIALYHNIAIGSYEVQEHTPYSLFTPRFLSCSLSLYSCFSTSLFMLYTYLSVYAFCAVISSSRKTLKRQSINYYACSILSCMVCGATL